MADNLLFVSMFSGDILLENNVKFSRKDVQYFHLLSLVNLISVAYFTAYDKDDNLSTRSIFGGNKNSPETLCSKVTLNKLSCLPLITDFKN